MNVNEFSIACKLINLKLRGFEVPKTLPPTLVTSLVAAGGTPTALSPVTQANVPIAIAGPPPVPPQPILMQQQQQQQQTVHAPPARPAMPPQPQIVQQAVPPAIPPQPVILQQALPTMATTGGISGYAIPGNYVAQPQMIPSKFLFYLILGNFFSRALTFNRRLVNKR